MLHNFSAFDANVQQRMKKREEMTNEAEPYARFGELLNKYLNLRDRSAKWLAQRLRVSPSTVTRWVNGETRPKEPERVVAILDVLSVNGRKERTEMLEAAGYAVAADSSVQNVADDPPISTKEPNTRASFVQQQVEAVHFLWNDSFGLIDGDGWPQHVTSWEGRLLYALGKLVDAMGTEGFLRIVLGVALWAATVALVGPLLMWPLADPAQRAAACIKFVIGLYALPILIALLTKPEGMEIFCRDACPHGKVLLLKLAGAATAFFAFSGMAVFAALIIFDLSAHTPPTWLIALLCLVPLIFAYASARRTPLDRYYMFENAIKLHAADGWALMAALVFAPTLAAWVYMFQWMMVDRWHGTVLLLTVMMFIAWNERRRTRQNS